MTSSQMKSYGHYHNDTFRPRHNQSYRESSKFACKSTYAADFIDIGHRPIDQLRSTNVWPLTIDTRRCIDERFECQNVKKRTRGKSLGREGVPQRVPERVPEKVGPESRQTGERSRQATERVEGRSSRGRSVGCSERRSRFEWRDEKPEKCVNNRDKQ